MRFLGEPETANGGLFWRRFRLPVRAIQVVNLFVDLL
jgi:hypothetical protein